MQDFEIAARKFAAMVEKLALSVESEFVSHSKSRNANKKHHGLNWRCTIKREGRTIPGLELVDYWQGSAHCPAHKAGLMTWGSNKRLMARAVAMECETGKIARTYYASGEPLASAKRIAPPTVVDVLESLTRDSDVLDYPCFEEWAKDMGFDPDSRKDQATYRACLALALALRSAIGDGKLQCLRQIAQEM